MNYWRSFFFSGVLCFSLPLAAVAQNTTLSGTVTDSATQELLPGVTVVVVGTTRGTATDINGEYSLNLEPQDSLIEVRAIGYTSQQIAINNRSTINIVLQEATELLDEVVVSAIGIEKDLRKVGYAISEVDDESLRRSGETNLMNALSAKAPGVVVTSSSGTPGASSTVRIRGNKSINGSNEPLYVIDGVPIDNSYRGSNFTDQANRAIDLNPDDIANVSILKGGAASALYGVRAANGAIIITTKRAESGKLRVDASSSLRFDEVNKLPGVQQRYAQGEGGQLVEGTRLSWGPLLDTLSYDGSTDYPLDRNGRLVSINSPSATGQPANAYDNPGRFFRTGVTAANSVTLTGGTDKSSLLLSIGDSRQTGIVPETFYNRSNVRVSATTQLADKLKAITNVNYITSRASRGQRGSNLSGVMLGLYRAPVSFDLGNGYSEPANTPEAYTLPDGSQRTFHSSYDNPYWSVNKNRNEENLDRFIGSVELSWQLNDWATLYNRVGADIYSERRLDYWDRESNEFGDVGGAIFSQQVAQRNLNNDLYLSVSRELNTNWGIDAIIGHNYQDFRKQFYNIDGFGFVVDNFFDVSNIDPINILADDYLERQRAVGAYGDVTVQYRRTLYLSVTGRNDWLSNLPEGSNSFFYPSASLGYVFTENRENLQRLIPYGKLRASVARSGGGAPGVYLTSNFYVQSGATQGLLSYAPNSLIGSSDLRPEMTTTTEFGADLRFLNNRLRTDVTWYNASSVDQIVEVPIPSSTGYLVAITNIGEIRNYGWEILISADVLEGGKEGLTWQSELNFTRNRNEVVALAEGLENIALPSVGLASTQSRVIEGQPYGVLFGSRWQRNENGDILVDENGYPLRDIENGIIGDPNPDFTAGWRNTFQYRQFSLSFLLDVRVGGDLYNGTKAVMKFHGTWIDTENREETFVFDGVNETTGEPNTVAIRRDEDFYSRYGLTGVSEDNVETVNWLRMRDISLGYAFTPAMCKKIGVERLNLSVSARNAFLLTNYTGIDPETSLSGAANGAGRDYFNMPNTRSWAFNLQISF